VTPPGGSQRAAVGLFAHDRRCGAPRVAGADEAGRGCLAGPLVAASVCLDLRRLTSAERRALGDLDDSKRLAAAVRERLAAAIWVIAEQVVVASADPATIDRDGLHRTNLRLLAAVLGDLDPVPGACLVDGFALGADAVAHRPIAGGDRRSAAIAAASVIAKVTRDRMMCALAGHYPDYGFDEHMGYATPRHREAIARFGPSTIHRRSFASAAYTAYAARGAAVLRAP
jgi:ribonuclease HII